MATAGNSGTGLAVAAEAFALKLAQIELATNGAAKHERNGKSDSVQRLRQREICRGQEACAVAAGQPPI